TLFCKSSPEVGAGKKKARGKTAVIHLIQKISTPATPSDMRPISILPVVSRALERLVVSKYLLPSFKTLPAAISLTNKFSYTPTIHGYLTFRQTVLTALDFLARYHQLLKLHQAVFRDLSWGLPSLIRTLAISLLPQLKTATSSMQMTPI